MVMKEMMQYKNSTNGLMILAALVIVLAGVMYAKTMVASLLLSVFIAINLSQPISWLQNRKVPKGVAIVGVFSLIITIIVVFGGIVSNTFSSFSEDLPKYEDNLRKMTQSLSNFLVENGFQVSRENILGEFDPSKAMSTVTGFLSDFGDVLGNSFTILFLTLFLLIEFDSIPIKLKVMSKDNESLNLWETIGNSIRHYLSIKTITSALTGLVIWIALEIIGVDYAIIWAIIAFLLNFIPNIGSVIAAVPAMLFSLVQLGFEGVVWTTIVFVLANTIVGNVVEPRMMGKGLGLSIFIVFLSLIFWGFVLGTVGMFLSVPLTMAFKIAFEQNTGTRWAAILLGTEEDAKKEIEQDEVRN